MFNCVKRTIFSQIQPFRIKEASVSHISKCMLGHRMNECKSGASPSVTSKGENAPRQSNRLWAMLLRSQKPNNEEISSIHVPRIPALPGLLKGNETQANSTVWENRLCKK